MSLISAVGVLRCDCVMLYYMCHAQLFLQSQLVPQTETAGVPQLFLAPHNVPHTEQSLLTSTATMATVSLSSKSSCDAEFSETPRQSMRQRQYLAAFKHICFNSEIRR